MAKFVEVPLSQLLLDLENPRFGDPVESQPAAFYALAEQQGRKLVLLAKDIVEFGVDPLTLPAVVATPGRNRRYRVIEGNRRTLALKALETPSLVLSRLSPGDAKTLAALSLKFHTKPVESIMCVLFDKEEDALHWITLRHTGLNEGVGLVEWNSDEKDRFETRHGGKKNRNTAGQVVDFMKGIDGVDPSKPKIKVSSLRRILSNPESRKRLGLALVDGRLVSAFPKSELAKGLRRVVEDMRTMTVDEVYTAEKIIDYVNGISEHLPDPALRLQDSVPLDQVPDIAQPGKHRPKKAPPKKKPAPPKARVTVVPASCQINPTPPRINAVYNELAGLDVTSYPNSASVLFRVFLELSVDEHLEQHSLMSEQKRRNTPLAKRLKAVADDLYAKSEILDALRKTVHQVADSQHTFAASVVAFNQYVHNPYTFPKPGELQVSWDELQPFLEKVWP